MEIPPLYAQGKLNRGEGSAFNIPWDIFGRGGE
jgi:hypothetical protein